MAIASIISASAAIASAAMSTASAIKASKEKGVLTSESSGERAMLNLQSQKAADLSAMGGLSAGQYQRAQMPEDVLAQQNQTMANTLAANPLMSAYRKEAFAKMALANTKKGIMENQLRVEDIDAERAAKNAFMAVEAADKARRGEAVITERKNRAKLQEIAQKQAMWQSFGKIAASTGKLVSAGVEAYDYYNADINTATDMGAMSEGLYQQDNLLQPELLAEEQMTNPWMFDIETPELSADNSQFTMANSNEALKGHQLNNLTVSNIIGSGFSPMVDMLYTPENTTAEYDTYF